MRTRPRVLARVVAATATIGLGVMTTVVPASAHVGIVEGDYHADSYVVVPFSVPHGCDGSPTTRIRIQMPESIPSVTPTVNPGWDIELVKEQLATPLDLGEGRTLTERVTEVAYTARTPLPDGYRDVLELSLRLPADAVGQTLTFPTIQECAEGSTNWTQIPAEGQDPDELELPAPSLFVFGPKEDPGEETNAGTIPLPTTTPPPVSDESDDGSDRGLAIAGLAAGVVGMALGGRALMASKGSAGAGGTR